MTRHKIVKLKPDGDLIREHVEGLRKQLYANPEASALLDDMWRDVSRLIAELETNEITIADLRERNKEMRWQRNVVLERLAALEKSGADETRAQIVAQIEQTTGLKDVGKALEMLLGERGPIMYRGDFDAVVNALNEMIQQLNIEDDV